jgi:hypothetical protein
MSQCESSDEMRTKNKAGDDGAQKLLIALRGVDPIALAAAWPDIIRGSEIRAKAEAQTLLVAADSMGMLALGDHIEKNPPGSMTIAWLVKLARAQLLSQSATHAAKMKNADARQWVQSEWLVHRAEHPKPGGGFYKMAFARKYAKRIAKNARFNSAAGAPLKVTPERIARYWLTD